MSKNNNKKNSLDREEFGFGYDVSPDDLDVRGQNTDAKNKNNTEDKTKSAPNKNESEC